MMVDIEDILSRLDKKTRDRVKMAQEVSLERLPLASIGLTKALDGGIGKGRQTLIYGNKSAGKTSILLQSIAEYQKRGLTCAWIDSEGTYDAEWASRLGVDNSKLIVSQAKAIPDFITIGCELLEAEVDFLGVDSISAMVPSSYFEKNDEFKDGIEGAKQIGQLSKELGIAVNKFNYVNKNTALVLISQTRNQFNTYGASPKPMGGMAMQFFSTTVLKLWSSAAEAQQINQDLTTGNKIHSMPVGRPVNWTVEFNKIGPSNQIGSYDFYYRGDNVGVDTIGEIADIAEQLGIISKGGAWYQYGEEKIQGRAKLVDWLKNNVDIVEEIHQRILNEQI